MHKNIVTSLVPFSDYATNEIIVNIVWQKVIQSNIFYLFRKQGQTRLSNQGPQLAKVTEDLSLGFSPISQSSRKTGHPLVHPPPHI